jgi:rare lipoprotein A (peptidoglycan hydrolase)
MADGSIFNMHDPYTIATGDRDIPLGTKMTVHNIATRKSLDVVVRDRMNKCYHGLDIMRLDLSLAGAVALGIVEEGRVNLTVEFTPPQGWVAQRENFTN